MWTVVKLERADGKGGLTDQGNSLKEIRIANEAKLKTPALDWA